MIQDYIFKVGGQTFIPNVGGKDFKVHQIESVEPELHNNHFKQSKIKKTYTYASALTSFNEETRILKIQLYNISDRLLYRLNKGDEFRLQLNFKHSVQAKWHSPSHLDNSTNQSKGKFGGKSKFGRWRSFWASPFFKLEWKKFNWPIIALTKDNINQVFEFDLTEFMLNDGLANGNNLTKILATAARNDETPFVKVKPIIAELYSGRKLKLKTKIQTLWIK